MNTQTTATGAEPTAAQYRDGQTIRLPKNWTMEFVMNWDADEPYLQAFVYSPRGRNQDGASLNAARHEGTTTGDEMHEIPQEVMAVICDERFDEYA
jgi:hypothetical protein